MKKMSHALNGRLTAYADALGQLETLCDALRRNVYRVEENEHAQAAHTHAPALARYTERARAHCAAQSWDSLSKGMLDWPAPTEATKA
jgi:hypothetical protein